MFQRIFFIAAILCLPLFSAFAAEDNESLAARLDSWVGLRGNVTSANGGTCVIDIGKKANVIKGMAFNVRRLGAELKHPLTGVSLGRKTFNIGVAVVTEVFETTAKATFKHDNGSAVAQGDAVVFARPIDIKFDFKDIPESERTDIKFSALKNGHYQENENSDYTLGCAKNSQKILCSLSFGGSKIFEVPVAVTSTMQIIPRNIAQTGVEKEVVSAIYHRFDEKFISVAAGKAYGKDKNITIATALDKSVYIYEYDAKKGLLAPRIVKGNFDSIVNIELVDINGNGIDELIVSNVKDSENAHSYIYEFDGKVFKEKKFGIPLLFRTFYADGEKALTCQEYADGDFAGRIFGYAYADSEYSKVSLYDNSLGMRLYGFAYGKFGNRDGAETISFTQTGDLTMTDAAGKKTTFQSWFGDTTRQIVYSKTLMKGVEKSNSGEAVNIYETKAVGYPIYQRIIEVDTGKFLFSGNEPVARKATGVDEYKESFLGVYMMLNAKLDQVWKSSFPITPVILESDVANHNGALLVVVLTENFKKNGGAFESSLLLIDVKKD